MTNFTKLTQLEVYYLNTLKHINNLYILIENIKISVKFIPFIFFGLFFFTQLNVLNRLLKVRY